MGGMTMFWNASDGLEQRAMQNESRQSHWQNVYTKKGESEVSWFQENPAPSLELIEQVGATPASAIIDIGGGASRLVDNLVGRGFEDVTVLDLSEAALEAAKVRLGNRTGQVNWIHIRRTTSGMIGRPSISSLRTVTVLRMSRAWSEP
jgi:2-polyprenyl-3-methyl-5-hydroxy-6-metoxy-1,4-benzoquinol methylase